MAICCAHSPHTQHKQQSVKLPYSFVTNTNIDVTKEVAYNTVKPIESTSIEFTLVQFGRFDVIFLVYLLVSLYLDGQYLPIDLTNKCPLLMSNPSDARHILIIRLASSWWVILCGRYLRGDLAQSAPRPIFPFFYQFKWEFEMAKFVIWTENWTDYLLMEFFATESSRHTNKIVMSKSIIKFDRSATIQWLAQRIAFAPIC